MYVLRLWSHSYWNNRYTIKKRTINTVKTRLKLTPKKALIIYLLFQEQFLSKYRFINFFYFLFKHIFFFLEVSSSWWAKVSSISTLFNLRTNLIYHGKFSSILYTIGLAEHNHFMKKNVFSFCWIIINIPRNFAPIWNIFLKLCRQNIGLWKKILKKFDLVNL